MKVAHDKAGGEKDIAGKSEWEYGEGCIASDMITKKGWKVGYMFRDEPLENQPDSGWHFFKGDESDEYSNDANNFHVFALNTVCNYDQDIIPYLNLPVGTHLTRTDNGKFIEDNGQAIVFEKQWINRNLQGS